MKKLLLLPIAITALLISSCQKEKLNIESTQESFTIKKTCSYSQIITIFDATGEHSVDYTISSDNKEIFENGINSLQNMEMKLIYDKPDNISSFSPKTTHNPAKTAAQQSIDYNNTLMIKVSNVKKGLAKGFELVPTTIDRTDYMVSYPFKHIFYVLPEFANWYRVTNLFQPVTATDYASNNGSSWTYSSEALLLNWHDFSSTNSTYRAVSLRTLFNANGIWCVVSIY